MAETTTEVNLTQLRAKRAQFRRQAYAQARDVLCARLKTDPGNRWLQRRIEHCAWHMAFSLGYALALRVYDPEGYRAGDYRRARAALRRKVA